jgi:hypothetical protein
MTFVHAKKGQKVVPVETEEFTSSPAYEFTCCLRFDPSLFCTKHVGY